MQRFHDMDLEAGGIIQQRFHSAGNLSSRMSKILGHNRQSYGAPKKIRGRPAPDYRRIQSFSIEFPVPSSPRQTLKTSCLCPDLLQDKYEIGYGKTEQRDGDQGHEMRKNDDQALPESQRVLKT